MSTSEIVLWVVTGFIVITMISRTLPIAVAGIRFWLRPNAWLVLRGPVFLVAVWCVIGGIELTYDINLRAWFSASASGGEFRWWMLLLTPLVLSIASLGFTVPYLAYFFVIPHLQHSKRFGSVERSLLSALVAFAVPALIYAVMYAL